MAAQTISTTIIEYREIRVQRDNFEIGADGDFERLLKRADSLKNELSHSDSKRMSEMVSEKRRIAREMAEKSEEAKKQVKDESMAFFSEEETYEDYEAEETQEDGPSGDQGFKASRPSEERIRGALIGLKSTLSGGFQRQLSFKLMAKGNVDDALNGLDLSGAKSPSGLLKNILENLGSERGLWNLDEKALPALGQIFSKSGLNDDEVSQLMAELAGGPISLNRLLMVAQKAEQSSKMAEDEGGLTVSAEGLGSLGQFFLSLGMSPEAVKTLTSDFAPGQKLFASDLRDILSGLDEPLAPCISDGDLGALSQALKAMGLDERNLSSLSTLLAQNQGQVSMEDFLGLLSVMEQPKPEFSLGANEMKEIQNLLANTSKDTELVKAPVFNEIIIKLSSLGDREIDKNFSDLSPALQALRSGLGSSLQDSASSNFDHSGRQNQGRDRDREERLALAGIKGHTLERGLDGLGFSKVLEGEFEGSGNRESLARQLEKKLIYSARRGIHRLKMDLDPESLGRLDVELKVKGDQLTANIKAESLEAYQALEGEISSLKESLGQAGLELKMTLSFNGQDERDRSFTKSGRSKTDIQPEETPMGEKSLSADNRYMIDKVV